MEEKLASATTIWSSVSCFSNSAIKRSGRIGATADCVTSAISDEVLPFRLANRLFQACAANFALAQIHRSQGRS